MLVLSDIMGKIPALYNVLPVIKYFFSAVKALPAFGHGGKQVNSREGRQAIRQQ
jgi:hypothetical protein